MVNIKEPAPESEQQKFGHKCNELRKRIAEVEESNEISTLALARTRASIRRLRLEYAILLERLECRALELPEDKSAYEAMARPSAPSLVDEIFNSKAAKSIGPKAKKTKPVLQSAAALKKAARDPNLPKRPTNAYLMFCEKEKDRVRAQIESDTGKPTTEVSKMLTEIWKTLNDEQRKPYLEMYEEDRARYRREMLIYNNRKKDSSNKQTENAAQNPSASSLERSILADDTETPVAVNVQDETNEDRGDDIEGGDDPEEEEIEEESGDAEEDGEIEDALKTGNTSIVTGSTSTVTNTEVLPADASEPDAEQIAKKRKLE